MINFRGVSLRNKLIVPIILFTVLILVVSQTYSFIRSFNSEQNNLLNRVTVLASGVTYNLQAAILFDDSLAAHEILDAFSADSEIIRVKLYGKSGQLFAMYEQPDAVAPLPTEHQRAEILNNKFSIGEHHIFLRVPVKVESEVIGYLRIIISKQSFSKLYKEALFSTVLFFTFLAIAGSVLYLTVQKYIIDPVFSLNQAMKAFIDRKETPNRLASTSDDEIGDLVSAFNAMFDRLNERDREVSFTWDKLEEEKSFANEVVEAVQHALVVVNEHGHIVHFNPATTEVFKCTPAYLKGSSIIDLINTENKSALIAACRYGHEFNEELYRVQDVFNQAQLLQISCRKLSKPGQFLFAIQDVTEVETAMARQRLAAGVFENSQDGLVVMNQDDIITMVNPAVTKLIGYSHEQLINRTPNEVLTWHQFGSLMPTIKGAVEQYGQWQGEVWERHSNGKQVPMFVKVNRIVNTDDASLFDFVFMLSDLSNIKEMERLEYLAHHDSLTGLGNRACLYRTVDDILGSETHTETFALLYLDLDGFKQVNDTYGHDAGDEVLKQVAQRLLSQVRSQDLVTRLSGDEFVVLVQPTDLERVKLLSERLLTLLSEEVIYKSRAMKVGVSIGAYFVKDKHETLDSILKAADTAMYQAKTQGKGQYVVSMK